MGMLSPIKTVKNNKGNITDGCPGCYGGLKGKAYCPVCGTTKEPPLDERGIRRFFRPPDIGPKTFTDLLSQQWSRFKPNQWYIVKFKPTCTCDSPYCKKHHKDDEPQVLQCVIALGPMVKLFDGINRPGNDYNVATELDAVDLASDEVVLELIESRNQEAFLQELKMLERELSR